MKQRNIFKIAFCFLLISNISYGQLSVTTTNTNFSISFDATVSDVNNGQINGTGFETAPTLNKLDADAWRTTGFTENVAFGTSCTTGDCARGTSATSSTAGVYAFEVSTGDFAIGVTPTTAEFTPGSIILKAVNNTGSTVTSMTVSYEVWVLNSQGRSNSFNFAHSANDVSYANETTLDFTSIAASDALGWSKTDKTITINGLTLANGGTYYLQWYGDDVAGSGFRDRFALDDIVVNMVAGAATPGITLTPVSGNTNESGTTATFTAVLNAQTTTNVVLNISSANTNEVTVSPATLTFTNANWETPQQITLTGVNDVLFDGNQNVIITVSVDDPSSDDNYDAVLDVTRTVTNEDDDVAPSIGFGTTTSSENETNVTFTSANIPITVSNYSAEQIDINVSVTGGTAEMGDYTFTSPTALSFTANGTQNITVDINDDADTNNETIIFTITETSSVTGLIISQATHTLTIVDDEAPAAYNSVGTFVKITDVTEIVDSGYYVLVDETQELFAMNNTHDGTLLNKTDVTPSSNTLTNPAISIVWEIKTNGGGKSIFNSQTAKYVSYTGSNNNIQIVDDVTTDNQRWTITYVTNEFQITNIALNTRRLQYNSGSPRFAAYTGTLRDIDLYKLVTSTTWTGNVDTNWSTAGNWSDGVPTVSKNALIPDVTNAPVISTSTNANVFNLTITEPDGLTINSGGTLIANGTSSGNVTYNRTLGTENWYLVSSPVAGEAYDNAYVAANSLAINGSNNAIGTYNDAAATGSKWSYMQTNAGATFTSGTGYTVRRATAAGAGDIYFTGTINTSDVPLSLATAGTGFNLIGNPYTAHLNSASFLTDNTSNLVSQTLWVFNQSSGNYETYVTASAFMLAPTQGFFVRASATSLNIAESYQAITGGTFQKSAKTEVKLMMTDGTADRFAKVYYLDNATTSFDNGYDGETFGGISTTLDVFTQLLSNDEGKKYQLQSLPNSDYENMVVPVGVIVNAGKEITFTTEAINLPSGINVYLEDKLTNTFTRLDEANSNYKVTLTENANGIGRFYLHTKSSALSVNNITMNAISIYKTTNSTLRITGLSQGKASISMYTMLGKQVLNSNFSSNGVSDIALTKLATGIYIVHLASENGTLNKKITLE